jgi:uncharacterized protein YqgV (UPF0045/DUF77 family)
MTQANATQESLLKLVAVYPKLAQLEHKLQNMSQEIQADFAEVLAVVKELIQPEVEAADKAFDSDYNRFNKIQEANNYTSIWSIYEVKDMNAVFGFVDTLTYSGITLEINKNVTWLEMWEFAENLICSSEDFHHIYIESFNLKDNDDNYELTTGS